LEKATCDNFDVILTGRKK